MYNANLLWHSRIIKGELPSAYALINTGVGWRAFGTKNVREMLDWKIYRADGSYYANGSIYAGNGYFFISFEGSVVTYGDFTQTASPIKEEILLGTKIKEAASFTIEVEDTDDRLSRIVSVENLLSKPIQAFLGYLDRPPSEHVPIFYGIVVGVTCYPHSVLIEGEEA